MKRSIASYKSVSNSRYPDNTIGLIDAPIDRADKVDIADSFLNLTDRADGSGNTVGFVLVKTIAVPFADLQECGSSPFLLSSAIEANIMQSFIGVSVKFIYGTEAYDFVPVVIKQDGAASSVFFLNEDLNASADFFRYYSRQSDEQIDADWILTTEDGSDPSQGDGALIMKVYYTIEDFN